MHEGKKYPCDACAYLATEKEHLRTHKQSVHEGKKPFPCSTCDYRAAQKGTLKRHEQTVHGETKENLRKINQL